MAEKTIQDQTLEIIKKEVKNTKFVLNENNTGWSWFEGKTRLVKLLKTKKLIKLEINLELSKNLENLENMVKISKATAHAKHLGTMKYLYTTDNIQNIQTIIKDLLENYKKSKQSENSK